MSAQDRAETEHRRLRDMASVVAAETVVTESRIADLMAAQEAAQRRWAAAKGEIITAQRDGGADRIRTARSREQKVYAEFNRISDRSTQEMLALNAASIARTSRYLDQVDVTWQADAEAKDEVPSPSERDG